MRPVNPPLWTKPANCFILKLMKTTKNLGFTVLELLLVILLIGSISAFGYSRVERERQNTRNKERESELRITQQGLEAFYSKNGAYPKTAELTDPAWVTPNLSGLDVANLTDPKGQGINQAGGYTYSPTSDGTANCDAAETKCAKYTLTADLEKKPKLELKSFN